MVEVCDVGPVQTMQGLESHEQVLTSLLPQCNGLGQSSHGSKQLPELCAVGTVPERIFQPGVGSVLGGLLGLTETSGQKGDKAGWVVPDSKPGMDTAELKSDYERHKAERS